MPLGAIFPKIGCYENRQTGRPERRVQNVMRMGNSWRFSSPVPSQVDSSIVLVSLNRLLTFARRWRVRVSS